MEIHFKFWSLINLSLYLALIKNNNKRLYSIHYLLNCGAYLFAALHALVFSAEKC